jgi:hypothetical protein
VIAGLFAAFLPNLTLPCLLEDAARHRVELLPCARSRASGAVTSAVSSARPRRPPSGRSRRKVAIVAGILVVAALGVLTLWYFTSCGNCGRSPILCDDPCTLPTFGQARVILGA